MYYYPAHYEARYEHPSQSYDAPRSRVVSTHYYIGNPYITSYSDGRFELLRRTPIYSSVRSSSVDRELSPPPRSYRASSIPPRYPSVSQDLRHSSRASSVPPTDYIRPSIVHFTPKMADHSTTPNTTYSYFSRLPDAPGDKIPDPPKRCFTANPMSFGPRIYTSLSVFPTMRHSSYNLLAPIDRYRYRTTPTKAYSSYPSTQYYSYPTPTRSTSSAYRQSDLYPTRFQINRVTYPSMERFWAGRRTLY